jgi:hypothetical protein
MIVAALLLKLKFLRLLLDGVRSNVRAETTLLRL